MLYHPTDLDKEIRELQVKIDAKRRDFDEGIKQDRTFGEMRRLFGEIKELEKRLAHCFEEANAQRES